MNNANIFGGESIVKSRAGDVGNFSAVRTLRSKAELASRVLAEDEDIESLSRRCVNGREFFLRFGSRFGLGSCRWFRSGLGEELTFDQR